MASQTSLATILKFESFKEELHTLLDNVLDQAETLQTTAEEPVVLDREWIFEKLREQVTKKEYVLESGAMQMTQGLGDLIKLPRELRDIIYGHAIVDGNTAILLASKQTNKETSKLVFQKGIYRLALGFGDNVDNPAIDQSLSKNIRNLHLRVNASSSIIFGLDQYFPILHMFDGSSIERGDCVVKIECCPYDNGMEDAARVVSHLESYTGFERVILELEFLWYGEPWPDTLYDFQTAQIWGRICGTSSHLEALLEPALGTGVYSYDAESVRLAFYPRK